MSNRTMRRQLAYAVVFLLFSLSTIRPSIAEAPTLAIYGKANGTVSTADLSPGGAYTALNKIFSAGNANQAQYKCLAQAVYFEARGEPIEGQVAVAQVVMNRLSDRRYPRTICGVVYQNETRRHRCQFSFACDGKSDTPHNGIAWMRAKYIASLALNGMLENVVGNSTHYHATYSHPEWANELHPTVVIGRHKFYRELNS